MAHVAAYKQQEVKELIDLFVSSPVVGVLNMENMPAPPLQKMRARLRGKVVIRMSKRRFMKLALQQAKAKRKGIEILEHHLQGMPALMFTQESPFKLAHILQKSKSAAPAKAGQKAPRNITVNAGPTPFSPGPIIGELGQAGIPAGVENGKVVVKKDTVVAKEGDVITPELAALLARLGIEPMEIGLDLTAAYEDGQLYTKAVLSIDEETYLMQIAQAAQWGMNLALEIAYLSKETIVPLVGKAYHEGKALAVAQDILTDATVGNILAKAQAQAHALQSLVGTQ